MKVIVCQRGARHRYTIPKMLEAAGLLEALYTDSTAYSLLGRIAGAMSRIGVRHDALKALAARRPKDIPASRIFSSDRPMLSRLSSGRLGADDLGQTYTQWGLRSADVVYSMYGEDTGFLEWSKVQGAKIIVDVFVHPKTNRIVADETSRVMGTPAAVNPDEDQHSLRVFRIADILLCPSEWVAEGVREFAPEFASKIRVLPYGSSLTLQPEINAGAEPGRILFAGREALRKGLHHLAEAAFILQQSGHRTDVRVAGVTDEEIRWMPHAAALNALGILPMDQMHLEFRAADIFVLPSLSEGQAGVLLEAMSFGCAIVATRESGVDFDPGAGVTVPVGNPETLARAIAEVIDNRPKRNELASGALKQAEAFSLDAWQKRLVECIGEVVGQGRND